MAPMIHAAALCLVALCTVQAVRAAVTAEDAPDDLYLSLNLARRGKIDINLAGLVEKDATIVQEVVAALPPMAGDDEQCAKSETATALGAAGFILTFAHDAQPNYRDLVQTALTVGLGELSTFPDGKWGAAPWKDNEAVANLGYLLWSASTKVGCAVSKGCTAGKNLVLCRFTPTAADNSAPFGKDYYDALKKRTEPLSDMTREDLESASSMAVPSVLLASLVVALAMASV